MGILSIENANKIARSFFFCLLFQLVSLLTKRACIKAGPLCIRTSGITSFSFKFNDSFNLLFYPITNTTTCNLEKKKTFTNPCVIKFVKDVFISSFRCLHYFFQFTTQPCLHQRCNRQKKKGLYVC